MPGVFWHLWGTFAAQEKLEICLALALVDKGWSGGHNEKASLYA